MLHNFHADIIIKMAENEHAPHLQVKFFTKQEQYSVPDSPFSLPITAGIEELSVLINSLLQNANEAASDVSFDFLINGEFLRTNLELYVQEKEVSTESVVEIEYLEREPAPTPEDSLLHDDWVAAISASNNTIVTGCYDNTVRLWSGEGDPLCTIPGHTAPVKCVAWIRHDVVGGGSTLLSGSHDGTAALWRWSPKGATVDCLFQCRGHAGSVDCVAVNPSKTRFCSGSWDKMLKIWSAKSEMEDSEKTAESEENSSVGEKPSKRSRKGAADVTNTTRVMSRVPLMTLSGHTEGVAAVTWLSASEILSASWDHSLKLWDLTTAACKTTISGSKAVFSADYSAENGSVITGSADRHIRLYDPRASDGALVKSTFSSHTGWVTGVAWNKSNPLLFLSGSYDKLVKLWDTRSPKAPLYDLTGHEDRVLCVDWSMPERMLSGGCDNTLKIFNYTDKQGGKGVETMDAS